MKKLGFGLMRLPLLNAEDATSVNYDVLNRMVDDYLAKGFTYFDTAYVYHRGISEASVKRAIAERHPRESFQIATKMPTFAVKGPEDYPRIFNEQLERCGVSYFDNYLLHNLNTGTYPNTVAYGGFEFVQKMKAEGKIKRVGFSFHDSAALLDEILSAHPEMEFVQLQINYVDWESQSIQSWACYEVARKHGTPIIVMEPIKGGLLAKVPPEAAGLFRGRQPSLSDASWAVRFAASLPGVELVLSGMSDWAQLADNVSYMEQFQPLDEEEKRIVWQVAELITGNTAIPCTACQYCVEDCPKHIPIPRFFGMYNEGSQFKDFGLQRLYYMNMTRSGEIGKASACIGCQNCERHCPQHIRITERLKEVAGALE